MNTRKTNLNEQLLKESEVTVTQVVEEAFSVVYTVKKCIDIVSNLDKSKKELGEDRVIQYLESTNKFSEYVMLKNAIVNRLIPGDLATKRGTIAFEVLQDIAENEGAYAMSGLLPEEEEDREAYLAKLKEVLGSMALVTYNLIEADSIVVDLFKGNPMVITKALDSYLGKRGEFNEEDVIRVVTELGQFIEESGVKLDYFDGKEVLKDKFYENIEDEDIKEKIEGFESYIIEADVKEFLNGKLSEEELLVRLETRRAVK